ncbi:MAG: hypothetical protein AAF806_20985, partial [Bacteroidota bacterium]
MTLKIKKSKTIVLPIAEEIYEDFLKDRELAKELISDRYALYPDLFPKEMLFGYSLNGSTRTSKKQEGFVMRQILINKETYRIRPSFMLPYNKGLVSEVSKALFLKKFGVPFWALAHVFGHNPMWWYRLYLSLGHYDLVGSTIYEAEDLPQDLLADEHHIMVKGEKKYVATTAAMGCFLGMAVCDGADEASLMAGYQDFKEEALLVKPDYEPRSVNTDGWFATQNAWLKLFISIQVIECFLHAFLKARDRATKKVQAFFVTASQKIWNAYRAESKRILAQQIRRLREWTNKTVIDCPMKDNILKFCKKKAKWMKHLDFHNAYRTSNMLDRLMRVMKKHKINSQMFHSTTQATTLNFRALALIHNFSPYSPALCKRKENITSPVHKLNKKVFADDWLENLI